MSRWIEPLLVFEALLFACASLVHAGVFVVGFEHERAATAEGVIAAVLLLGLVACRARPAARPVAALLAQGFALIGVLVGAAMILMGVGPQTPADYLFHVFLLLALGLGLVVVLRAIRRPPAGEDR